MNKNLNLIVIIVFCMMTLNAQAEEKKCFMDVIIKNSKGPTAFGLLQKTPAGPDGEEFSVRPRALAIDSKGNIYVGDSVNYRVLKFNSTGKFLLEFKLQPPVKMIKPEISHIIQDIGTDKDDNVYVLNYFEDRVEVYNPDGKFKGFVISHDDKQGAVFAKIPKGKFSSYIYEINSYVPDKKYPGAVFYSIIVVDVSGKDKKVISKCSGAQLDSDEDGLIYSFDDLGNIYTFDAYLNVIRINPFK